VGFDISSVQAIDGDTKAANEFNQCLGHLAAARKSRIEVRDDYARSKIAWKLAGYQQAVLYRVVMLANGSADAWNAGNLLSSILCARALIETVAMAHYFEQRLDTHIEEKDFAALNVLAESVTFATRNKEWLKEGPPWFEAINVLTAIDKLDRLAEGVRGHYDRLSERCHPNYLGHYQLFAALDTNTGTVTFSETRSRDKHMFLSILAAAMLIEYFEVLMRRLEQAISRVAQLHHEASS
jgi:hypothetical protein